MTSKSRHPLSFQDEAARLSVTSYGVPDAFPIEVKRIVGSAGKAERLEESFRPRGSTDAQKKRWRQLVMMLQRGEAPPPITVYELHGHYFVIDGHKRVAAAKALGVEYLDAIVIPARTAIRDPAESSPLASSANSSQISSHWWRKFLHGAG